MSFEAHFIHSQGMLRKKVNILFFYFFYLFLTCDLWSASKNLATPPLRSSSWRDHFIWWFALIFFTRDKAVQQISFSLNLLRFNQVLLIEYSIFMIIKNHYSGFSSVWGVSICIFSMFLHKHYVYWFVYIPKSSCHSRSGRYRCTSHIRISDYILNIFVNFYSNYVLSFENRLYGMGMPLVAPL